MKSCAFDVITAKDA